MTSSGGGVAKRPRAPDGAGLAPVRRLSDERAYLYQLIQTIGSGPDLDSILRGVVRLVTEAIACHACFIYFLRDDTLELRTASNAYEQLEESVRIPMGEGLTGWVARARRSAFIKERALEDPRVRRAYFPELGDEVYQSLVSVPIFSRAGDAIGVITLHAEAPHEFARGDLDFLEHTASLIAGAVDNARLYEDATARVALLTDLSTLSRRIASASTRAEVLEAVTDGVRDLLRADRSEIYLVEADGRLGLGAARPHRRAAPIDLRSLWLGRQGDGRPFDDGRIADTLFGTERAGSPVVAPLDAGEERLGILAALLPTARADGEAVLAAVAAHTAVALKQHEVIEWLREKNLVKDFFQALARPDAPAAEVLELADRLGCDVDAPHVLLHVVPWKASPPARTTARRGARTAGRPRERLGWQDIAGQVESRLAARFPGLLFDRLERSIRALVPIGDGSADDEVASLREMDWGSPDSGAAISAGVSNPCRGVGSFAVGFEEAASAAEVGALIRGRPGLSTYDDLGPYKYVLGSDEGVRDRFQQRLELLVDYDAARGTQLVETLEAYLEHRGNVVGTSRSLYIHPNTLRQRLDRIQRVTDVDLEREDWLSLAVATKVVKLRRLRRTAGQEGGKHG